jgi:hypothetical protein
VDREGQIPLDRDRRCAGNVVVRLSPTQMKVSEWSLPWPGGMAPALPTGRSTRPELVDVSWQQRVARWTLADPPTTSALDTASL